MVHVLYPSDNSLMTSGVIELYTELRSGTPNWPKVFKRAWEITGFIASMITTDPDIAAGAFAMHQITAVDPNGCCDCDGQCGQELVELAKKLDVPCPEHAITPYRCGAMTPVRAKINAKWLAQIAMALLKLMPTILPLFLGNSDKPDTVAPAPATAPATAPAPAPAPAPATSGGQSGAEMATKAKADAGDFKRNR